MDKKICSKMEHCKERDYLTATVSDCPYCHLAADLVLLIETHDSLISWDLNKDIAGIALIEKLDARIKALETLLQEQNNA